ncbi:hypothetical protein ANCDUO_04911 [Ancylostoma duodenale]|uniref:G-protein coupled receptors family 1 profile domain-containing protein n=1 Tax=Ancylostoma duodenale TaxID=51022 RepID=A0A0C2H5S0_9BILA|nr:hypothetical protein ANCDUO_04911 [Ancylostoma duodenale]
MDDIIINGGFPSKYQCTNESRTAEEPNIALGIYCIVFGVIFISLYLLCLAALTQRDLRSLPVYKIMIFLSICDIAMLVANSILTGFFFIKGVSDNSWIIAGNNLLTVTSTFALYIAFFLSFLYKYNHTYAYRMASREKQMFLQSCAISGVNVSLALIYVYMLYFPVTIAVTIAGLILWQFSSAGPVIVYMVINKTVRRKVLQMFSRKKKMITTTVL